MKPLTAITIFFTLEVILCIYAWQDVFYGPTGLFWYHKEEDLGHMLAFLGWKYNARIFGKHYNWKTR